MKFLRALKSSQLLYALVAILSGSAMFLGLPLFIESQQYEPDAAAENTPAGISPTDPDFENLLCGPVSLSIALGRIGVSLTVEDIASHCQVTSEGVAFADLERAAKTLPEVSAKLRDLNWQQLRKLDCTAVLFVSKDHFVAVDPREVPRQDSKLSAAMIRVYQPGQPAAWWDQERLEGIWEGRTLVLQRTVETTPATGPRIEWREVFIDQGILEAGVRARYRFSFRNIGQADLTLASGKASCTCVEHSLSHDRFAHGEEGFVDVTVDLGKSFGYLRQELFVESNDPQRPETELAMAAGLARSQVTSSEFISIKNVPQGGSASAEFYVADPGFNGVKIREATSSLQADPGIEGKLSNRISSRLIGKDASEVAYRTAFRVQPKDHAVTLTIEATELCPPGQFEYAVDLVLDADVGVLKKRVIVEGAVIPDVVAVPPVAVVVLKEDRKGTTTVSFRSHSNKTARIEKVWSDTEGLLTIEAVEEQNSLDGKYTITAIDREMIPGTPPVKRAAYFQLDNGSVVSVPVAIFCPAR